MYYNRYILQLSIDHTNTWLKWTQTMKAKPSKCICLGMKLFENKIKNEQYIPTTDSFIHRLIQGCPLMESQ